MSWSWLDDRSPAVLRSNGLPAIGAGVTAREESLAEEVDDPDHRHRVLVVSQGRVAPTGQFH